MKHLKTLFATLLLLALFAHPLAIAAQEETPEAAPVVVVDSPAPDAPASGNALTFAEIKELVYIAVVFALSFLLFGSVPKGLLEKVLKAAEAPVQKSETPIDDVILKLAKVLSETSFNLWQTQQQGVEAYSTASPGSASWSVTTPQDSTTTISVEERPRD